MEQFIERQWRDLLQREAQTAVANGEVRANIDPGQLAFELGVVLAGTDIVSVPHDDLAVIARARTAIHHRTGGAVRLTPARTWRMWSMTVEASKPGGSR